MQRSLGVMKDKSDFFKKVYEVVKKIPVGRVTTYGAIARHLGSAQSARVVGWAMNHSPEDVPAHRVVNRLGLLTGKLYFGAGNIMQQMLESEGIKVKDDMVQNIDKIMWVPKRD